MPASPERLRVFAVEDTAVQLAWGALPPGDVTFEAAGATVTVAGGDRPGAVVLEGLPSGADLEVACVVTGRRTVVERLRTLEPPPGPLLARFATMNDMHLGEMSFGLLRPLRERDAVDPYPLRCARAALAEALAWGAECVVLKGDLTWSGRPWQWEQLASVFAGCPVPVHAVLGNHDVGRRSSEGLPFLTGAGIQTGPEPWAADLQGIRLVMAQTSVPRHSHGEVDAGQRARLAELAGAAPGAVFLAMHHYPHPWPVTNAYPPGIPQPVARALLDAVADANPATFVSTGHSHRHRRRHHGPLVVTEVGSTKDYPGTWAGYAVHEGGIRQVVRRVAEPSAIAWTERTRRVVGGVWGVYSPGVRTSRCFVHRWPDRRPA